MAAVLADTHALIWYIEANSQLSAAAGAAIDDAIHAGDPIYVSAISLVEIAYLIEKGRFATDLFDRLCDACRQRLEGLTEVPVDLRIADVLRSVPASIVPDMPDRIIAATAVYLDVPLLTKDAQIQASGVTTIW